MIEKARLEHLYVVKKSSMAEVASDFECSIHKISYWMDRYGIARRSISEAIYQKHNPLGDPFRIKKPKTLREAELYGLGIGLYWGEGTKKNKYAVRLGNTDPELIIVFIKFLKELCGIRVSKLRYGLQLFSDIEPEEALAYWMKKLKAGRSQFFKITVTISGAIGTYRNKSKYGVLTVYYGNKKLRDILVDALPR